MTAAPQIDLFGAQVPRIRVIPDGDPHPLWPQVEEMLAKLGIDLDPWQCEILFTSLMRQGDQWAAFAVGVCCPRQNGKNAILEARELAGPIVLGERLLIHSAHLADTAKEAFHRLKELSESNAFLDSLVRIVRLTNGFETIEFMNGARVRFRSRTRGGGRGWSASPVIFDEAMYLPEVSMGAMMPSISAQPDPQIWYTGSAVDQMIQEDGVVFSRVRERALENSDPRLAYWEWSLDKANPSEVESVEAGNPESWAATNPALGIRITPAYIAQEIRQIATRTFAVERLGVGDWPMTDGTATHVMSIELWDELADDPRSDSAVMLDPIALAFDVNPERTQGSIAAAGMREDGKWQIEVIDRRLGTAWIPKALDRYAERNGPVAIVCDASGPAGTLIHQIDELGWEVEPISAQDHAKACGLLFDHVHADTLRHLGGNDLRDAIKGATKRPLGDAWAWSRRHSAVDISPLVASTLALWGASTAEWSDDVVIY